MKHNIYPILAILLLAACQANDEAYTPDAALEIRGIAATINGDGQAVTRATDETSVTVGRSTFVENDKIVFTDIYRTTSPLEGFIYKNIRYQYDGKSWERIEVVAGTEKIYWTDGASSHTFVGYSLPLADYPFDKGDGTYAGELGASYTDGPIDFSSGNEAMKAEDVLLNYNASTKAETGGLTTKVNFAHALSNVRVVVDIADYAATSVDEQVTVSDLTIQNQPTKFTWAAKGTNIDVPTTNQNYKDIKLYQSGFSFYGLTTPHKDDVYFSFKVSYPNALNTSEKLTKVYNGHFTDVQFYSGKCTTLTITLNHRNEQMYMSVTYSDWNLVPTPDLGELRKKSTFMDINSVVTIHTDDNATVDDATWLYKDANDKILDVYGNNGSLEHPYIIKSASQMLSFAKEVKAGLSFKGLYIRLDADITMQASTAKTIEEGNKSGKSAVEWIGIGEDGKPFNGTFLGGDRYINRLYGKPLFISLGENAVVEQLHIAPIGTITGGGALADTNAGTIGGCKVVEDVKTTGGALVGTNSGIVYACYYTGAIDATNNVTKLVGKNKVIDEDNKGITTGCYMAAEHTLYDLQKQSFVDDLNTELTTFYAKPENANLTQFKFKHNDASYPTVIK